MLSLEMLLGCVVLAIATFVCRPKRRLVMRTLVFQGEAEQFLVVMYDDGRVSVATRERPEHAWGPPLFPVYDEQFGAEREVTS